jgi:1,4-alpha-glucan-branching enzyme
VCNFAGIPHGNYRVGLPFGGQWDEIVNTDALEYGGSGVGNFGAVEADEVGWNGRPYSASLELPPFGTVYLAPRDKEALKLAKIAAEEKRRAAEAEEAARAAEEAEGEELEAEDSEEAEGGED